MHETGFKMDWQFGSCRRNGQFPPGDRPVLVPLLVCLQGLIICFLSVFLAVELVDTFLDLGPSLPWAWGSACGSQRQWDCTALLLYEEVLQEERLLWAECCEHSWEHLSGAELGTVSLPVVREEEEEEGHDLIVLCHPVYHWSSTLQTRPHAFIAIHSKTFP